MFSNKLHEEAHNTLKSGDIDKAILLYSKALKETPDDCNILSDRAVAFLRKKDKERSFDDFNKAIELQPDYAYRYASRAFAKNHFGDIDGAIEDYEKAVQLDPGDAVAHNNLGLLLEQKGYKQEAEDRFKRADALSKQEDHLLEMIDELENQTESSESHSTSKSEIEDEVDSSTSRELKKVFTSRKQFKEFVQFVKNGFKIK